MFTGCRTRGIVLAESLGNALPRLSFDIIAIVARYVLAGVACLDAPAPERLSEFSVLWSGKICASCNNRVSRNVSFSDSRDNGGACALPSSFRTMRSLTCGPFGHFWISGRTDYEIQCPSDVTIAAFNNDCYYNGNYTSKGATDKLDTHNDSGTRFTGMRQEKLAIKHLQDVCRPSKPCGRFNAMSCIVFTIDYQFAFVLGDTATVVVFGIVADSVLVADPTLPWFSSGAAVPSPSSVKIQPGTLDATPSFAGTDTSATEFGYHMVKIREFPVTEHRGHDKILTAKKLAVNDQGLLFVLYQYWSARGSIGVFRSNGEFVRSWRFSWRYECSSSAMDDIAARSEFVFVTQGVAGCVLIFNATTGRELITLREDGMSSATGLAFDRKGNLFVCDTLASRVYVFELSLSALMRAQAQVDERTVADQVRKCREHIAEHKQIRLLTSFSTCINHPQCINLDWEGNIVVAANGQIRRNSNDYDQSQIRVCVLYWHVQTPSTSFDDWGVAPPHNPRACHGDGFVV